MKTIHAIVYSIDNKEELIGRKSSKMTIAKKKVGEE
jgi:hypothetical protein